MDTLVQQLNVSHVYKLTGGWLKGLPVVSSIAQTLIHGVFQATNPHGDRFAAISYMVAGCAPIVPHMVRHPLPGTDDMRHELGIPANVTVIGRLGGATSFDVDFVHQTLMTKSFPRMIFLLVNTKRSFCRVGRKRSAFAQPPCPSHLRFLPAIHDEDAKARFIRTCDAMLHARTQGETFGLAIAEFAAYDKPVFTKDIVKRGRGAPHHLEGQLGRRATLYHDSESLTSALLRFDRNKPVDLTTPRPYAQYNPVDVTWAFYSVFLMPLEHECALPHDRRTKNRCLLAPNPACEAVALTGRARQMSCPVQRGRYIDARSC